MPKGASRSEAPFIDFSSSSSSAVPANMSFAKPLCDLPFGAELHGVTRRFSFAPVMSIDYHNVLDRVNVSRRRFLKLSATGQLRNLSGDSCCWGSVWKSISSACVELLSPRGNATERASGLHWQLILQRRLHQRQAHL